MRYLTAIQERARAAAREEIQHAAELMEAAAAIRALGHSRLTTEADRLTVAAFQVESDARHRARCAGLADNEL